MAYIIDTDGNAYFTSEFLGASYNGYMTTPYTRQARCVMLGDYIPIYQIWEDFYTSDFDNGNGYGGYFRYYVNSSYWYVAGKVISVTEPDETTGKISALVVYRIDNAQRTLAERQAEIANGQYTYSTNLYVAIVYTTYNVNYDYNKFIYAGGNNNCWLPNYGCDLLQSSYSRLRLLGVVGWQDGVGTLPGNTLCIPFLYNFTDEPTLTACGLIGSFVKNGGIAAAGSYADIIVSEDPDDYITIGRGNCCEFSYVSTVSSWGFDFKTSYNSGYEPPQPPTEHPFEDDSNEGGGGTGDYRDTSDTIPIDGTPTNSAIASGFVNAYLLTQQNVLDFHNYLYSTDFLTNVKKLMNDPIDYILAFMLAPYTPDTSAATNIMIGGTNSEVAATRISSGYKTLDCGTITLSEFWGKFYDYNPYTKVQIYLPFIGMRPLDVDDVMAGDVNLKYRIDVLTGACVATISVNNARGTNGAVYSFNGNCHSHIPVSGKNYLETVTNVLTAGVGMAGSIASGNALGVATGAINVMRSAKEQLEHAGELTGAAGLLANYTPFLMVSRPSQSLAANYNHYKGFISNITKTLGELSGYTEVAELVQTNIHCTLDEFDEINELLKEGVYL